MIIYVGTRCGTSQKTGKDYQILKLAELKKARKNVVYREREFFVDPTWDFSDLSFGDIVKVTFGDPVEFGGYPPIIDVAEVGASPYIHLLESEDPLF